ncbi:MAG: hypothetical protein AABZ06_03305, partial [Bdellovibrionota bacterium]
MNGLFISLLLLAVMWSPLCAFGAATVASGTVTVATGSHTANTGLTVSGGTFTMAGATTLMMGDTQTLTVSGGTFQTTGTNDVYPQTLTNKAIVTRANSSTWDFTATSGTVDLTGFLLKYLGTSGLNIGGTTILTNLNGGQLTNLSTDYVNVKAIQINTTGTIPATAQNFGWEWGDPNSYAPAGPPAPAPSDTYYLAYSTGCNSQSISFTGWFGDWRYGMNRPVPSTKVSATGCTITISDASTSVSLLSFTATGYDGTVFVDWTTGLETNHIGFNVYRSTRPDGGYVQVNSTVIRNTFSYDLMRGKYRYADADVVNGVTYYYYIEDIDLDNTRTRHGPVSAAPLVTVGAAPTVSYTDTNVGVSPTEGSGAIPGVIQSPIPSPAPIQKPAYVDIGGGVHILAQTRRSLRLEVAPPLASFSPSTWNQNYEMLEVSGYANTVEAGKPELVERMILVEVDPDISAVTLSKATVQESTVSSHRIQPAAFWSLDGSGQPRPIPLRSPDQVAYSISSYTPSSYYQITGSTQTIGGKNFVQVKIMPVIYLPSQNLVKSAEKIVLDLGLDAAQAWLPPAASCISCQLSPAAIESNLRIRYRSSGVYQLTYEDMLAAGVDGPFAGADTTQLRLYRDGHEIPLEVISQTGRFLSGDAVRFFVAYARTVEDDENEVVLSLSSLPGSVGSPLRIQHWNADPTGLPPSVSQWTRRSAVAEVDAYPIFNVPLGDLLDHFYWTMLYTTNGNPPTSKSYQDMMFNLPDLALDMNEIVNLKIHAKGRGALAQNPTHHVGVYVNSIPYLAADSTFNTLEPVVLSYSLPASYFIAGNNTVRFQVVGDLVQPGDSDLVFLDRAEIEYPARFTAVDGIARITNNQAGGVITVTGFGGPAAISAYDVSDSGDVLALDTTAPFSTDGGVSYNMNFAAVAGPNGRNGFSMFVASS